MVAFLVEEEWGLWEEWMSVGLGVQSTGQQEGTDCRPLLHALGVVRVQRSQPQALRQVAVEAQAEC